MKTITPVILAGGSGTRLWPLSRKSYPKQFSNIIENKSLFQQAALRLKSSKQVSFGPHLTITNSSYRFIVSEQLQSVGIDPGPILIEPEAKNTAPAVLAASLFAAKNNKESILLVAPSDHVIPDTSSFHKIISLGLNQIKFNKFIVFGIQPTGPETGYGYIETESQSAGKFLEVIRFIEKPNQSIAQEMIEANHYYWNAGIFMFRAQDMITAFEKYCPKVKKSVQDSINKSKVDLGFIRLEPKSWKSSPNISIDHAIMEKANNLTCIPYSNKWSDLGGWKAVWEVTKKETKNGVALSGNALALECTDTLLRSESENQELVGLGLQDIIAIAMNDAVLVAHKDKLQDVGKLVQLLKSKKTKQAEIFPKDFRPWGWFESLALSKSFQVKRICVNPGAALSLQSHQHRSEHWIVVEGKAKVTIDKNVKIVTEGASVYIPLGSVHRLENAEEKALVMIEVQTGDYLGEDDIVRYEDLYSRI